MAPEQHSGKAVDQRADVFALGVMLWEMLTGDLLFSGKKGGERSRRLMRGEVATPSSVRAKVPPELDAIVMRCLRLRPDERYATAGMLAAELGAFVRGSLFDPAELAALVSDHAPEAEPPTVASELVGRDPKALHESHALVTREDMRGERSDLELMNATTTRDRRPPSEASEGSEPAATTGTPPPAPSLTMLVERKARRLWWPVAVAAVVAATAVALLLLVPRPTPSGSGDPRRRLVGAQIAPVPAPPPPGRAIAPPVPIPPPAPAPRPIPAAVPGPPAPPPSKTEAHSPVKPTPRRHPRAPEAKPAKPEAIPAKPVKPLPEPRLLNPF
jgi:serine/threonine-protein kinase